MTMTLLERSPAPFGPCDGQLLTSPMPMNKLPRPAVSLITRELLCCRVQVLDKRSKALLGTDLVVANSIH